METFVDVSCSLYYENCLVFVSNLIVTPPPLFQPIYGFASGGPLRFKRAVGHRDLFYIDDKDLELKDVREYSVHYHFSWI